MTLPLPTTGNIESADLDDMFDAIETAVDAVWAAGKAHYWNVGFYVVDLDSATSANESTFYFYAPDDAEVTGLTLMTWYNGASLSSTVVATLLGADNDDLIEQGDSSYKATKASHSNTAGIATVTSPTWLRKGALYKVTLTASSATPVDWVTVNISARMRIRRA